jgi:hypothetical protein
VILRILESPRGKEGSNVKERSGGHKEGVHENAKKRAEQFFISLQQAAKDWLALGCTKTGMVYRLKGNEPQSHE